MMFSAEFSSVASKDIEKLDWITQKRIRKKIDALKEEPFPHEVERMESYKDEKVFRVRVGDQRILYAVRYNAQKLLIIKVDKKGRVYG